MRRPSSKNQLKQIENILNDQISIFEAKTKKGEPLTAQDAQSLKHLTSQAVDIRAKMAEELASKNNVKKNLDKLGQQTLREVILYLDAIRNARTEKTTEDLQELFRLARNMDSTQIALAIECFKKEWRGKLEKVIDEFSIV